MEEVIEEKIENTSITKILDLIYNLYNTKDLNNINLFELKDKLPIDLINKLNVFVKDFMIFIYYNNMEIPTKSKIFEFEETNGNKKKYRIYTENFFEEIVNKYKITNIVIIYNNIIREDLDFQKCLDMDNIEYFKVMEKKEVNYQNIFTHSEDNENKYSMPYKIFSNNYNYYFKNVNGDDIFYYQFSTNRNNLLQSLFKNKKPILCYCGPHGIGKTITFLIFKKLQKNVCYFNLKILFKNSSNPLIWKYDLLLKELAEAFKYASNYEKFNEIKEKLSLKNNIWESIYFILNFIINEKIEIQIVLDQYQEKLDINYKYIKNIIELIKNNNIISIIIVSSINDKDVRLSLINLWFGGQKNITFLNYIYLTSLLDNNTMKNIIDNDTSLSILKKQMIINDFGSIPKYYYLIKNNNDNELEKFKNDEINNIHNKIEEFFFNNPLGFEEITLIIKYNYQFGLNIEMDEDTFEYISKILPLKYFIIDQINNSISYYFPLVEDIFKGILSEKSLNHLQMPLSMFKPSVIGDLLEYNLTYDLSKNYLDGFNYVCKVDSIYTLKKSSLSKFENINKNKILFLQSNPYAKYIDFGILNKGEDLILFQCKKALVKEPKNYVKYENILEDKNYLSKNFENKLGIKIKNIYLLYITGISFYKENGSIKSKTWGINSEEDFKILIQICKNSQAELLYYDVVNKKIYQKINNDYIQINNLIEYIKQLKTYISIDKKYQINNG